MPARSPQRQARQCRSISVSVPVAYQRQTCSFQEQEGQRRPETRGRIGSEHLRVRGPGIFSAGVGCRPAEASHSTICLSLCVISHLASRSRRRTQPGSVEISRGSAQLPKCRATKKQKWITIARENSRKVPRRAPADHPTRPRYGYAAPQRPWQAPAARRETLFFMGRGKCLPKANP